MLPSFSSYNSKSLYISINISLTMADLISRLQEAKDLEVSGKYLESDTFLTSIIEDAAQTQDPVLAALYNQRGIVRRMLRQYDKSLADYNSALGSISLQAIFGSNPKNEQDEQKALAYINIADIHRVAHNDFGSAHFSLDDALTYSGNGTLMHAKAVDQRGLVFVAQENYDSAIKSYKRAREICDALLQSNPGDKDIENRFGQVVHHLGDAYLLLQDPAKVGEAYDSSVTALATFTKLGDNQGIVNAVAAIGKIASIKNDYPGAIKNYLTAWDILKETGYDRAITWLAFDLAEAHLNNKNPQNAIPYLERFRDGVLGKQVTEHDNNIMKEPFRNLMLMYNSFEMKIDNFGNVEAQFAQLSEKN